MLFRCGPFGPRRPPGRRLYSGGGCARTGYVSFNFTASGRRTRDADAAAVAGGDSNGSTLVAGCRSTVLVVGSSGGKPRKKEHKLPKVGSPENREYELHEKQKEAFGGWPIVLVLAILVVVFIAWIILTA